MGLGAAAVTFLGAAKSLGVDFTDTAMIGRQMFYLPDAALLRHVFAVLGIPNDPEEFWRTNQYGETLFTVLGARRVASVDASPYEGATLIHDLNLPIPDDLRGRFSAVYDGGSLEHIFNIPQALKNCMEMVKIGGHFLQLTVANNFMGHGFWQFSPEALYRALSPANGYQVEVVLLHEVAPGGGWYIASDPERVHMRVELCNAVPTYILCVARRVAAADIFATPPQQNFWVEAWKQDAESPPPPDPPPTAPPVRRPGGRWRFIPRPVKRLIPGPVKQAIKNALAGRKSPPKGPGFDKPFYRRIDEDALLRGQLT